MPIINVGGFKVYDGQIKALILPSDRISEGMNFFSKSGLDGIALEREHGYTLNNIDFLIDYPDVKSISISNEILDINGIYNLKNLHYLILSGKKRKLDFSFLPNLIDLKIEWSTNLVNLKKSTNLKRLSVYNFSSKDRSGKELKELTWLNILELTQANINTLDWLSDFEQLQDLRFNYCPNLNNISSLEKSAKVLKVLLFDHCKHLRNHSYVERLNSLRILGFNHCGEIESIDFIRKMKALEDFRFVGSDILDGDLNPCLHLKYAGFNNKKHYSHTSVQLEKNKEANA